MTEKMLRETLQEAKEKGQIGLIIWANWRTWDELAFDMKLEEYNFILLQASKEEEATITMDLCGFCAVGGYAVSVQKLDSSAEFFSYILEVCKEKQIKGPITFVPLNEVSKACY